MPHIPDPYSTAGRYLLRVVVAGNLFTIVRADDVAATNFTVQPRRPDNDLYRRLDCSTIACNSPRSKSNQRAARVRQLQRWEADDTLTRLMKAGAPVIARIVPAIGD
jgi:hypothetical protein